MLGGFVNIQPSKRQGIYLPIKDSTSRLEQISIDINPLFTWLAKNYSLYAVQKEL